MEAFSILLNKGALGGFLSGYRVRGRSGEEVLVMHLLFVDDTCFLDCSALVSFMDIIVRKK